MTTQPTPGMIEQEELILNARADFFAKTNYAVSMVSPDLFDAFAHQARKIFHEHDLGTLLDSIREKGIKTPLTARRSPNNLRRYELVAGERRLRAARQLGLAEVPVFIRELTDSEAEEESLIENMARVNLTPVEEANAFKRMLELTNDFGEKLYTLDSLALKIGRKEWEIRAGVKMLSAPESLLKEIDTADKDKRRISLEAVQAVARIPDPKLREVAAKEVMSGVSLSGGPATGKPLSADDARTLVRTRYMSKIDLTATEAADEALVPMKMGVVDGKEQRVSGGSCKDCPFRSGCMTDLSDLLQESGAGTKGGGKAGIDPNICVNPSCLKAKRDELWHRRCDKHLKDGGRVMTAAEAKKEFSWQDRLIHSSAFAKLSDGPEYRVFNKYDVGTWAQLIKGLDVIVTLARVPETGKEIKLITIKEAAEAVKARWKEDSSGNDSKEDAAAKAARQKQLRAEKIEKEMVNLGLKAILARITKTGLTVDEWSELFDVILGNAGADGMTVLGPWLGVKLPKGGHKSGRDYEVEIKTAAAAAATTPNGWLGWCVLASIARGIKYGGANATDYKQMIAALEIDTKALKAEAATLVDAKAKAGKPAKPDKKDKPLKPGEKGDSKGAFDTGDSGAKVRPVGARTEPEKVYDASQEDGEEIVIDWQEEWDALPKKPAKDSPEFKPWDAARKRIKYNAAKAGITLITKAE